MSYDENKISDQIDGGIQQQEELFKTPMKLIGMTDFVLEQLNEQNSRTVPIRTVLNRLENYANFLKQPLKLGMFVPTDEAGNVLEEPEKLKERLKIFHPNHSVPYNGINTTLGYYITKYKQAKERVLFEGFELVSENYHIFVQSDKLDIRFSKKDKSIDSFRFKYIEDLTSRNLTLTETAIKQIGL